jgi:hypothetical protein
MLEAAGIEDEGALGDHGTPSGDREVTEGVREGTSAVPGAVM